MPASSRARVLHSVETRKQSAPVVCTYMNTYDTTTMTATGGRQSVSRETDDLFSELMRKKGKTTVGVVGYLCV